MQTGRDQQECCRLCSTLEGSLVPMFSPDNISRNIAQKIFVCYSLVVNPKDPFSKYLCLRCFSKLDESWRYRQLYLGINSTFNNNLLISSNLWGSKDYLQSIISVTKSTNLHKLLDCRTDDDASKVYDEIISAIKFPQNPPLKETVELIDIISDEEDVSNCEVIPDSRVSHSPEPSSPSFPHEHQRTSHSSSASLMSTSNSGPATYSRNVARKRSKKRDNIQNEPPPKCYNSSASQSRASCISQGDANVLIINEENPVVTNDTTFNLINNLSVPSKTGLCKGTERNVSTQISSNLDISSPLSECVENKNPRNILTIRRKRTLSKNIEYESNIKIVEGISDERLSNIDSDFSTGSDIIMSDESSVILRSQNPIFETNHASEIQKRRKLSQGYVSETKVLSEEVKIPSKDIMERQNLPLRKLRKNYVRSETGADDGQLPNASKYSRGNRYACKNCSKSFKLKIDRKQHRKICDSTIKIPCKYCSVTANSENELFQHNRAHIQIQLKKLQVCNYLCEVCDRYFYPKTALELHKKIHSAENEKHLSGIFKNILEHCDKTRSKVSVKVEKYVGEVQIKKDLDKKSSEVLSKSDTAYKRSLNRELRNIEKDDESLFADRLKVYFDKPKINGLNMEGSQKYSNTICKYCCEKFADSSSLWKHMVLHHKFTSVCLSEPKTKAPFQCNDILCQKKFHSLKSFVVHSQDHFPLTCNFCDFSTKRFSQYMSHVEDCSKNILKERDLKCCNRYFVKKTFFYLHKLFECDLFKASSSSLSTDGKILESNNNISCVICNLFLCGSEKLLPHLIDHVYSTSNKEPNLFGKILTESDKSAYMRELHLHSNEENFNLKYDCPDCKDEFVCEQSYRKHLKGCFSVICTKCKLSFRSLYHLLAHNCVQRCEFCLCQLNESLHECLVRQIILPKAKSMKCSICNEILFKPSDARKHIFFHFPSQAGFKDLNIHCRICNSPLISTLNMDLHYFLKHSTRSHSKNTRSSVQMKTPERENGRLSLSRSSLTLSPQYRKGGNDLSWIMCSSKQYFAQSPRYYTKGSEFSWIMYK